MHKGPCFKPPSLVAQLPHISATARFARLLQRCCLQAANSCGTPNNGPLHLKFTSKAQVYSKL
jgi:hypothetical protein